jgi:hypothetical protein
MNIHAELGGRVEGNEGAREWGLSTVAHAAARIRPFGVIARIGIGSMSQPSHEITQFFAVRSESAEATSMSEVSSQGEDETPGNSHSNLEALDVLLSRYRLTLFLVAYRVLGDRSQAEDAVQRCLLSTSWNRPHFENEGAFRGWLVKVLIDEALLILHQRDWAVRVLRTDEGRSYPLDPEPLS